MYVAGDPSPLLVALTCLGGYLSAGGAGAVNHWFDRDIDARMARTATRPIPSGRVSPRAALAFGCTLAGLSLLELSLTVNLLAAALSFAGFLGYVFVYTVWLKRRTPQNIVIGGAAGAVPPLVGWAAVTGSVSGTAVILFFIVFFWTPPHFWALSLLMKDEYAKVGVPMLPVVRGEAETRRQILLYSVLLYAVTQLPFCAGGFGADLPRRLARARARLHRRRGAPVPPRRPPLGAAPVPVLARLPRAAVLRDGRRRPPVGEYSSRAHDDPTPRTQEHPHRADRGRDLHVHVRHHVRRGRRLRLVSPLDPEIPPVGEEIHLPGPSILPVLTAVGITLALVGITTFIEFTVVGVILTVGCVVRWIKDTRREIDELPLD